MQRLPSFAQSAARFYTQTVYCFPYNDRASKKETIQHLKASIQRLEEQCPLLAGTLHASSRESIVSILPGEGKIPLEILITGGQQLSSTNNSTYFDSYYSRLASSGFPPQAFVGHPLDLNNKLSLEEGPVPVCHVRATFVPGGLLIWLSIHHTIGDDYCLNLFTECLATATRGQPIPATTPRSAALHLPKDPTWSPCTLMTLARECPEFDITLYPGASPSLPDSAAYEGGVGASSAVPKTGKIFVFSTDRLEELRNLIYRASGPGAEPPSVETCLAVLTLAHVTQARLATEVEGLAVVPGGDDDDNDPRGAGGSARLITAVDWRRRGGFERETAGYFGNAFVTLLTRVSTQEVRDAYLDSSMAAMARVVARIGGSVAAVDREAVVKRDALFHRVGDCRRLLLRRDGRRPAEVEFNSWRAIGADAVWNIPGVLPAQPDAVRRVQGDFGMGNALILPARSGSRVCELLIELPEVSMERLCQESRWMTWVERVVG